MNWPAPTTRTATPYRWLALALLGSVQFLLVLDDTVVNVALASIQRDLGFTDAGLAWVVNAYLLAFGGLLLVAGRLGDVFGRRPTFMAGVVVFGAASLLCAGAQAPWQLVTGRFLQGAGAALAAPTALAMVTRLFTREDERARALAIWGALAVVGGTSGVVISGALTGLVTWRWIFLVNLPVVVTALAGTPRLVRDTRGTKGSRLRLPGAALATAAMVTLVHGLLLLADRGTAAHALPWLGIAMLLAVGFVITERRGADPLVPRHLLTDRVRVVGNLSCLLMAGVMFAVTVLLMLHLQTVLDYRPLAAGLAYLPYAAGILIGLTASSRCVRILGLRTTLVVAFVTGACGLILLARLPHEASYAADVLPGLVVAAVGSGLGYPALTLAALSGTTDLDAGTASALLNAGQQLGSALGIAILFGVASLANQSDAGSGPADIVAGNDGLGLSLTTGAGLLALGALIAGTFLPRRSASINSN